MNHLLSVPQTMLARPEPNHNLGNVVDDWEAVDLWLDTVRAKKRSASRQTEITYRYHLAKIRWYCETVSQITLSRWTVRDANLFFEFLDEVPANCLCQEGSKQGQPGWTPFRKQPSASSAADIRRFLHSLYKSWRDVGYIRLNPIALHGAGQSRRVNTSRSLSMDVYGLIQQSLSDEVPSTVCQRMLICRDQFIFAALRGLGLRATEFVSAKMSAFSLFTINGTNKTYWTFYVDSKTAKGNKARRLPVTKEVWDAFQKYRRAFGLAPVPLPGEDIALILSPKTVPVFIGDTAIKSTRDRQFFQAWSTINTRQGLYNIVKERMKFVATNILTEEDPRYSELISASPHWLRHTFAKTTLTTGQGMREVAGLLGHASLDTAMIYTEQDAQDLLNAWETAQPGALATFNSENI